MVYLITQRQEKNKHGDSIDVLEHSYIQYFKKFGMQLMPIPNCIDPISDLKEYIHSVTTPAQVQGIIITGGNDVNPAMYEINPTEAEISSFAASLSLAPERDQTEKKL